MTNNEKKLKKKIEKIEKSLFATYSDNDCQHGNFFTITEHLDYEKISFIS